MAIDVQARLGTRFEARAILVGERIDVRGIEPRLAPQLPVIVDVAPAGIAVVVRAGAVVMFGVEAIDAERFITDLGVRVHTRFDKQESERAIVRLAEADGIEPDALTIRQVTVERLQVIGEILAKSVVLARHESEIAAAFQAIEPMALRMKTSPSRLPWKQPDLVRTIGETMLVEQKLVDRVEVLEKPDLLWDEPDLDRFYKRLSDEYELRERYLVLDTKLGVVSRAAQKMLELGQARRALRVEYSIVALIVFEILLAIYELVH